MAIREITTKKVVLTGVTPILFDRYSGDNKTELSPEQKMYLSERGQVMFPSQNIMSFLTAQNTESATKRVLDKREYKAVAADLLSCASIDQMYIPITREGVAMYFKEFGKDGFSIVRNVARLPKGIPNPKVRPCIAAPWEIKFDLTLYPSETLNESLVARIFTEGGRLIGLGTFRGVYGKFKFSWS